jgi:hypothetical protein
MTEALAERTGPREALLELAHMLSLDQVKAKLADPEEGKGCSSQQLEQMEEEYRKFLALHLAFPDADIVPCKLVDEIWHQHILDTKAYRADCQRIFGRFLDHYPYFGMRGPEDAQALIDAYEDTLIRYREAFGEPPPDTWISPEAGRCRTACKPQKCR